MHEERSYARDTAAHKPAVVVIAGPSASGKSALALELACALGGIVINADALQIYRDLRVLTARPDPTAEAQAPHRLYGYLDAAQRGSAAAWRDRALSEMAAAAASGAVPILVGGSGLYLRALRHGLAAIPDIPEGIREEALALHRSLGGEAFRARLAMLDPEAAARLNAGDRQRLVRAFEVVRATAVPIGTWQRREPSEAAPFRFATLLLLPPRDRLYATADDRFAAMVEGGALGEAEALAARRLDPALPAMKAVGLPELLRHVRGEIPLAEAVAAGQRATRRYIKRQTTWFRHQLGADLVLGEPFSPTLLRSARDFVEHFRLTPLA